VTAPHNSDKFRSMRVDSNALSFIAGALCATAFYQLPPRRSASATRHERRLEADHSHDHEQSDCIKFARMLGLKQSMLSEIMQYAPGLIGGNRTDHVKWKPYADMSLYKENVLQRQVPGQHGKRNAGGKVVLTIPGANWLREAFIRMHQLVTRNLLVPATIFGEGRVSSTPRFDVGILPRMGFAKFFHLEAWRATPHRPNATGPSTCLCWDDCRVMEKAFGKGRCHSNGRYVFSYADSPTLRIDRKAKVLSGDLAALSDPSAVKGFLHTFDVIVCQETFEHIAHPFSAMRGLANLLAPGGAVFWSAPFVARTHGVPFDFFRYTEGGARVLFADAGLAIEAIEKVGDTYLTSAYSLSLGGTDFDAEHLEQHLLSNFTNTTVMDPAEWLYASVVIVARKPQR
jgi:hypothetical protein